MNTIPKYMKGSAARFDFRVPDGLGAWALPDWDDPDLKVELRDGQGTLQFIATVSSSPALTQGDDYDETSNPAGGAFVSIEGIDTSGFSLGVAEAWVYAKVEGVEVQPYPAVIAAFEVVTAVSLSPFYSTVDMVRLEVPGDWPAEITDEMVTIAIGDASRRIDAILAARYPVPFPDVGWDPATPPLIEQIARRLAAHSCMEWMGMVNASEGGLKKIAMDELERLAPASGATPVARLPGYSGPVAVFLGALLRGDDDADEDWMD